MSVATNQAEIEPWVREAIATALPGYLLRDKAMPPCPRCQADGRFLLREHVGCSYVVCKRCQKVYSR